MKPRHTTRDSTQRFVNTPSCDCCRKPVGTEYQTDEEVCGSSDGPGFFLCDRKRCVGVREHMDVEARRALYTTTRARGL